MLFGAAIMYGLIQVFGTLPGSAVGQQRIEVTPLTAQIMTHPEDHAASQAAKPAAEQQEQRATSRESRTRHRGGSRRLRWLIAENRTRVLTRLPYKSRCPSPQKGFTIDDVAFGVLTSQRFLGTRLHAQRLTWLKLVRHVVFYSETEVASLPTVALKPPENEELVGGGAWKNFPALMDLHKRFPEKKWVYFSDDDTFVFVENLLAHLEKYNPLQDYYVGLYWTPRMDLEWKEVQIAYASGGAGYAISNHLLTRLVETMPKCHATYTAWAGDVRVGKCIHDLGVRITPAVGFHHESHDKYTWDSTGGGFPYGHLNMRASAQLHAPVSFHHLQVDTMTYYQRIMMVEERGANGELYRWDFSSLLFKELEFTSPEEPKRSVRLLFGTLVESWRAGAPRAKSAFSDHVFLRRRKAPQPEAGAPGPGIDPLHDEPSFEYLLAKMPEVFNGDGCKLRYDDVSRQPSRQSAVVQVQCRPCQLDGSQALDNGGGAGRICSVEQEDDCTLRVVVSIHCPPLQLVYALTLDAGTRDGVDDLVSGGAPAFCKGQGRNPPNSTGFLSLRVTHGEIQVSRSALSASDPDCSVRTLGFAEADGGTISAARSPYRLDAECHCPAPALVLVTWTLALADFTSPVTSFWLNCSAESARAAISD